MAEKGAGVNRLAGRGRPRGVHQIGAAHAGGKRKAAGQRLAETDQIGNDAAVFAREPFSSAAKAGLNFVENHQRAGLVAQFSQERQKFLRRNIAAAACLDWLDQNRADALAAEEITDLKFDRGKVGCFFWKQNKMAELAQL